MHLAKYPTNKHAFIYYMPRFIPDSANRKMSDMISDMNSSSKEGTREKKLKTNITIHISTNYTKT